MAKLDLLGTRTWEAPELTSVNRLPMRSPLVPFADDRTARSGDREKSPWFRSLDGTWRFRLVDRPEDIPADFADPKLHDGLNSGWKPIEVPGNWTMQGWDRPIYTNVRMPFPGVPPEVPDENPTGLYRTGFTVPRDWKGRRVVLHVGGAESVLYVWVNGQAVGMGKDSRLPNEFDVTDHVKLGANTLACAVVKWSDASYVEDQDQWWHGGIHREVYLYATGPTRIDDVRVLSPFNPSTGLGMLQVRTTVGFASESDRRPGWTVEAVLETLDGKPVGDSSEVGDVPSAMQPYLFSGHVVRSSFRVPDAKPWSAEQPNLYRLLVSLVDPHGIVHEVVSQRVGFRSVEVRDRQLLVNGQAVMIHGVNRHDHHPERGKAVSVDDMRDDLLTMKRCNINAVRCSHYPNDSRFLDLCDELGFYVVDEANIESHAFITSLCHDPRYRTAILERVARMAERDKNHPSVIVWSLGNESGYGAVQDAAAGWLRRYDPRRPLQYESAVMFDLYADAPVTDIVCPMYASIDDIVAWSKSDHDRRRPLILCEYSHAMGNSNGSLADYYKAFETHVGLQGGFIWEWKDHGLLQRLDDGKERFAYGGQFGDEPNDGNFVADGLVGPDGNPHPALTEFAFLAAPVRITASTAQLRRKRVVVENRQSFNDLSAFKASYEVIVDGDVVQRAKVALPEIAAGAKATIDLELETPVIEPGQEAWLTFRVTTAKATPWAPKGHPVAWGQLPLASKPRASRGKSNATETTVEPVIVRAKHINAGRTELRLGDAGIDALRFDGREVLSRWPRPTLWRAPTDNDGLKLFLDRDDVWTDEQAKPLGRWLDWGLDDLRVISATIEVASTGADAEVVSTRDLIGADADLVIHHRQHVGLTGAGDVTIEDQVEVPDGFDDVPRVGVVFVTATGFEHVEWYGAGPLESYPDRRAAALLGRWRQTVTDQYVPYVMPQEHGLHLDTRWMTLAHDDGDIAFLVQALDEPFAFGASHFAAEDLWRARDVTDLEPRDETVVHIDRAHRGLGTLSCGPDTLPAYRVGVGTYTWKWRLRPFEPKREKLKRLLRQPFT